MHIRFDTLRSRTSWQGRTLRLLAAAGVSCSMVACGAGDQTVGSDEALDETTEAITEANGASYLESGTNPSQAWDDIWAVADSMVYQGSPDTVYGSDETITLNKSSTTTQRYAFVRFVVDNFTAVPSQALLWLYVTEGESAVSTEGLKVRVSTDAWSQQLLTYNNSPGVADSAGVGSVVADLTNQTISTGWFPIDVSSVVKGNGVYSFRLAWSNTSGSARGITFRTMNYREQGSPYDLNHQCGGLPCMRLQVTGSRNPRSVACPTRVSAPAQYGKLPSTISQGSGLIASAKYANYYYATNDRSIQTSPGNFFMIGPVVSGTATPTNRYTYKLPTGFWQADSDTEEIQVGPGPKANTSYVYLGDIGDNNHARSYIQILRVEEPSQASATVSGQILKVKYPKDYYADGQPQMKLNSEAFLIDPVDGTLIIIEKPCGGVGYPGYNRIFTLPLASNYFGDGLTHELRNDYMAIDVSGFPTADDFSTSCGDQTVATAGRRATGAAFNRTGTAMLVTFYGQTKFWWDQYRGDPYAAWGDPAWILNINAPDSYGWECDVTATNPGSSDVDTKREAISFTRDTVNSGVHFLTTGEASGHPIWRY